MLLSGFSFTIKAQPVIKYDVHNKIFLWGCTYNEDEQGIFTYILGVSGGNGNYTVSANAAIAVSEVSIQSNTGFEIFVPVGTALDDIDLTVTDSQGQNVSLAEDVKHLLHYASNTAYQECFAPPKCQLSNIVHPANERLIPDTYHAVNTIISSAILADRNTTFKASQSITLLPGFTTINLTNFEAKIEGGCN